MNHPQAKVNAYTIFRYGAIEEMMDLIDEIYKEKETCENCKLRYENECPMNYNFPDAFEDYTSNSGYCNYFVLKENDVSN